MKKSLLMKTMLLLCALITGTSAWATDVTFTFGTSSRDVGNTTAVTKSTVTVTVSKNGAANDPNFQTSHVRLQAGNKLNIASSNSITKVVISFTSSDYASKITQASFNVGTYSYTSGQTTGTWTGSTNSLDIENKASSQTRISQIVVTYSTASVSVTGVSLPSTAKAFIGKKITLTPTFTPSEATNKNVTWVSKNPSIATVSDAGVVTGVAEGTADIEVTTADGGFKATCEVTVETYHVDLTSPVAITSWPSLSYGDAADYEVGGIIFTATQCLKNSGLQFKKNEGILASPLITTSNGYTVIVTTNSAGTGTLTLQIGSETPVSITSGNSSMYSAKTSSTSTSFTLTNSSGNACNIATLTIIPNSAEVQSYGWATYIAPAAIEFAANTAYVVTAASLSGLTLAAVTKVPAGTPVLLKGAGNKDITVIESATVPATNLLEVSDGTDLASGEYAYVLAKNGEGACFKQWTGAMSSLDGRVMLVLDEAAAARAIFELDDETTGVRQIDNGQLTMDNYFDLQGRKVAHPSKGLYIVNGKKYVIK